MTVVKNPGCDVVGVTDLIQQIVTGSQLVTDVGAELSFVLPSSSVKRFPPLFEYLDGKLLILINNLMTLETLFNRSQT